MAMTMPKMVPAEGAHVMDIPESEGTRAARALAFSLSSSSSSSESATSGLSNLSISFYSDFHSDQEKSPSMSSPESTAPDDSIFTEESHEHAVELLGQVLHEFEPTSPNNNGSDHVRIPEQLQLHRTSSRQDDTQRLQRQQRQPKQPLERENCVQYYPAEMCRTVRDDFKKEIKKAVIFCRQVVLPTLQRSSKEPSDSGQKGSCARMTEFGRIMANLQAPARRAVLLEVMDELMDMFYISFRELKFFLNGRGLTSYLHFLTRIGLRACEWCEFPYFMEQWYAAAADHWNDFNSQALSMILGSMVAQRHNPPKVFFVDLMKLVDKLMLSLDDSVLDSILTRNSELQITRHISMCFRGYVNLCHESTIQEYLPKFVRIIDKVMDYLGDQELCGCLQSAIALDAIGHKLDEEFVRKLIRRSTVVQPLSNKGKRIRYLTFRYYDSNPFISKRLLKEMKQAEREEDRYISLSENTVVHLLKYLARFYHYHVESNVFLDEIGSRVDALLTKGGRKYLVQFDGPHHFYHPGNIVCRKDIVQQRILEKCGYRVLRVPYYKVYFNNSDPVAQMLKERLENELGIRPIKSVARKQNKSVSKQASSTMA